MKLAHKLALLLIIVCLVFAAPASADAALTVIAEPGADPAHVAMVQKTVDAFNNIISVEMGVTLDRDVKVFVCPTRESYRDVLRREFGHSADDANRLAKVTEGFSQGRLRVVAVHFDVPGEALKRHIAYHTTAHELFHQLQFQLAGNNIKSFYWTVEGTADLIGAAVAEKVGYQSLDKWKLDQINILRKAENHVSVQAIHTTDMKKWTTFIEEKQHPYAMANLMVFYLVQQTKGGGYRSITDYFRLLGQGVENEAAFGRAFGIGLSNLNAGFPLWFADLASRATSIEVIPAADVSTESVAEFNRVVDLTRHFFGHQWGRDLQDSVRFVLVSGKPAFATALVKEFGMSAAEAEEKARTGGGWYVGSTVVYNTSFFKTKHQQTILISGLLARRLAGETAPQQTLDQLFWLANGSCDVLALHIAELSSAYTKEKYRKAFLANLTKAGAYPDLANLTTAAGWNQAKEKHGSAVAVSTMVLAGLYLYDKYGFTTFDDWFKAVKETGSAETAFKQVFGMPVTQFYEEFAAYLQQAIKKAA